MKIHVVVASISPMKKSASGEQITLMGKFTDGKTNLRLVGFDTKLQQRLAEFHGRKRQWRFQIAK